MTLQKITSKSTHTRLNRSQTNFSVNYETTAVLYQIKAKEIAIMVSLRSRFIFSVMTIAAILIADLTITLINKYMMSFKNKFNLHIVTLIGIVVVLIFFYILIKNISKLSDWSVRTFVKVGKRWMGRSIGLYITVLFLFIFIYAGYYWAWFDRNLFSEIAAYLKSLF